MQIRLNPEKSDFWRWKWGGQIRYPYLNYKTCRPMRAHVVAFQFCFHWYTYISHHLCHIWGNKIFWAHRTGHSVVITFAGTIVLDFRSLTANCVVWSPVYLAASQRGTLISTVNKNVHNLFQITLQLLPQKIFPMWKWVVGVCWWIIHIATPGTTSIFSLSILCIAKTLEQVINNFVAQAGPL